jgi:hypothetical protein
MNYTEDSIYNFTISDYLVIHWMKIDLLLFIIIKIYYLYG